MDSLVTFVLTSCGRFDLLEQTLSSFLTYNTAPIVRYIVVEDSANQGVFSVVCKTKVKMEVLVNDPPVGQLAAIDRAYALVSTPYIFHCQDDWLFFRSGFIEQSLALLESFPELTNIICRSSGQNPVHDKLYKGTDLLNHHEIKFRRARLQNDPVWGGYSFNPGLRRLSDYRRLGLFAPMRHEAFISRFFRQLGKSIAALDEPAYQTIGRERSILNPAAQRPPWLDELGYLYRQSPRHWTQVSRNELCRCQSGKKFKHCHGALYHLASQGLTMTESQRDDHMMSYRVDTAPSFTFKRY
jgi:hypothetical protein